MKLTIHAQYDCIFICHLFFRELLECDAKSNGVQYDSDDLLSRMPKTRAMRHSLMECGELLCSVTIKNDYKKGPPGRSVSQGTFNALNIGIYY